MTDGGEPRPGLRERLAGPWTDLLGRTAIRCLQVLIVLALGVAVVTEAANLRVLVIPVLLAIILAAAFAPVVSFLRRLHVPNGLAAFLTLVLTVVVLGAVLTGVALAVIAQWGTLVSQANDGIGQLQSFVKRSGLPIDSSQLEKARKQGVSFLTSGAFASGALAGLSTTVSIVTGIVLLLFVLFYLLKDGRTIWEFLLRPLDDVRRARAHRIGNRSVGVMGGYVRGTALVALVDAVFIGAGLLILRVPLAIPLTVLVFVTAFIPVVGATIAGVVCALVALVTGGPVTALIVVLIVIVVNQLEGNLLQPLIMGRTVSLHPLVILLVLTAGALLAGVVGAVLAVPTAAVAWTAIKSWNE
ncbi:AI-2E family transporter [Amnibacterium sp. CER49]|uniref:AI-2E family transporter n=1 Tax=Amnibacterium sp. CER49 TaxID=3039161 RepID=UPI002446E396|nr:AI-2E family transporter [Amnibacterium sp. CER49]MDH2443422.1 AI-2E family transporter [Amnibacterium sp. CER49]